VAYPPPDPSDIEQCYPLYAYERRGAAIHQPFQVPTGENYRASSYKYRSSLHAEVRGRHSSHQNATAYACAWRAARHDRRTCELERETLIDVPYDFTNQITDETDMVLKPGNSLVTTCQFQNDTDRLIKEGSSTEEEMCMNVLTAWLAGSLHANTVDDGAIGCFE
jgi:hypothetical protein